VPVKRPARDVVFSDRGRAGAGDTGGAPADDGSQEAARASVADSRA
jgi:hypothetical protein